MTTRWRLLLECAVVAIAALSVIARPASVQAHARYDSSTPGKGEMLAVSPVAVEITFTQEVQKITGSFDIQVARDRGASVTAGPAVVNDEDRTKISVPLQPGLPEGRYVVRWNQVSDADGDAAEGAFSFYLNRQPNTIDLENDAQLEQIGAEEDETPAADETSDAGETPVEGGVSPGATTAPGPTVMPIGGPEGDVVDDDDDNTALIVIVVVVVAVVAAGIGGWLLWGRRRA